MKRLYISVVRLGLSHQNFIRKIYACLLLGTLLPTLSWAQGTIIDNGSPTNKWILHNPEDYRKTLFIAPLYNGNWDFSQQTQFRPNGEVIFSGNIGIGIGAGDIPFSRLHVAGGGVSIGTNIVRATPDGHLSLGDVTKSDAPTQQNWIDATSLLLNAQDYTSIGFHDSGNRVDFIRSGNGLIDLGYDGGWGRANIGLPGGLWNSAGTVGIGITSPISYAKLHVHSADGGIVSTGAGAQIRIRDQKATRTTEPWLDEWAWYATDNVARIHRPGLGDIMAFNGAGNVGIGTINPTSKLQISGGGLMLGRNVVAATADGNMSMGDILLNSSPTQGNWSSSTNLLLNALDYSTIGFHDSGNRVDFIRAGNGTIQLGYDGGYGPANIGFSNGIWGANGNVGIGTTNPGTYKLAVEGTIGAREIEVKTGSWADFVFQSGYQLRSLTEVADYIKINQHLPEIPSEAEVLEKGISLGGMNAKLLQKIEELTLYLIEQQKQLKNVQTELKQLREEVNR